MAQIDQRTISTHFVLFTPESRMSNNFNRDYFVLDTTITDAKAKRPNLQFDRWIRGATVKAPVPQNHGTIMKAIGGGVDVNGDNTKLGAVLSARPDKGGRGKGTRPHELCMAEAFIVILFGSVMEYSPRHCVTMSWPDSRRRV